MGVGRDGGRPAGRPAVTDTSDDHYANAADGWERASLVYRPLAEALVRRCPTVLHGRLVLDVGAGTGVATEALLAAGASPIAVDRSAGMVAWRREDRPPSAVADARMLPFRDGGFDGAVAAFVLNHLTDPDAGLREIARVVRPGGVVLATVYANSSRSAVRDRVDDVGSRLGFTAPAWYAELKSRATPLLGTVSLMAATAESAGLVDVTVTEEACDVGIHRAAELVDYRFGQAHYAGWLASLDEDDRLDVRARVIDAIEPLMEPYRPTVVFLSARTR